LKKRLAIVLSHPVQYYSPVFQLLTSRGNIDVKVFYTNGAPDASKFDRGFGKDIEWDIPLLEGYDFEFLENAAKNPGLHHFAGIRNPQAKGKIEKFDPHALLVYGWNYSSHLHLMRYFKDRTQVLFRGDSNLLDRKPFWKEWARTGFLRWVFSHVDTALYVGRANKAYFIRFGMQEDQLVFAPHSIDNNRFSEDRTAEVKSLREGLGLNENEQLILFAGKLDEIKQPDILIRAFLNSGMRNAHLLIVGAGVLQDQLKQLVANSETADRIHFLDFQNQSRMPVIYQSCNIFCLPSKRETWGLSVNEAMAAGKAVVVSDKVGCASDLVHKDLNGKIFASGNKDDLRSCLHELLADAEKLSQMGKASKNIIQQWSFEEQVSAIEKIMYA
jgi:glycosyltransferase involved in cell wall biosynthesis